MRRLMAFAVAMIVASTLVACSSQPAPAVQEAPRAASPDSRTVQTAEPAKDAELARKREAEERDQRFLEANLAIVEGKTSAVPDWSSALQYPSKWKGTCEAYAKANAVEQLTRGDAAERLGRNPKDIENLVRITRLNAARALYKSMKEFPREHCNRGDGPLSLSDPLAVFTEIVRLLGDASATGNEVGFSTEELRNRAVAGVKKEMARLREDLKLSPVGEEVIPGTDELARDRKSAAEFRVWGFLRSGITAEELGITAAEAKRIEDNHKGS